MTLDHHEFKFLYRQPLHRFSLRITSLIFLLAGTGVGVSLINTGLQKLSVVKDDYQGYLLIALGLFIIFWVIMSTSASFVTSSTYALSENGLSGIILPGLKVRVPWSVLKEARITSRHTPLPYRPLEDNERVYTIQIANLTVLHRLAALYYGYGLQSLLIITPDHAGQEMLIARLWELHETASPFSDGEPPAL